MESKSRVRPEDLHDTPITTAQDAADALHDVELAQGHARARALLPTWRWALLGGAVGLILAVQPLTEAHPFLAGLVLALCLVTLGYTVGTQAFRRSRLARLPLREGLPLSVVVGAVLVGAYLAADSLSGTTGNTWWWAVAGAAVAVIYTGCGVLKNHLVAAREGIEA